jgi:hypothetical protein
MGNARASKRTRVGLRLTLFAQLALASSACTDPTFVDEGADRDARVDEQIDEEQNAAPSEPEGATPDQGKDAAPSTMMDAGAEPTSGLLDGASVSMDDASSELDALDSGEDAARGADGGAEVEAGAALPSWALPLIGTYAKRSVTFSYDDASIAWGPINTRNVEYSILTISQRGDELELSIELCAFRVLGTDTSEFYFKNPAGMPKLSGHIMLGAAGTFSSERMVQPLGFDPARGSSCGVSGRRTRYADQSWSSAMCECRASTLPDSLNDCRVIDGDSDGRPGITGRGGFISASPTDVVLAFQYALTLADGKIKADKAHELRELRTQSQECLNASADQCNFGNNTLCATGSTTKLLHREGVSCANFPEDEFGALPALPATPNDCR